MDPIKVLVTSYLDVKDGLILTCKVPREVLQVLKDLRDINGLDATNEYATQLAVQIRDKLQESLGELK